MYQWPLAQIKSSFDHASRQPSAGRAESALSSAGLHRSLVDFLVPFYDAADGATFFDGVFRTHPLLGMQEHGIPDLVTWNDKRGWKQYEPERGYDTFYFCSNVFGDLFGVPVTSDGSILRDQIGILWVERYEYQEAVMEWRTFFPRILGEPAMARFFLRLDEYAWAAAPLGKPAPWECFSSNVPAVLGGPDTIENVAIQSLVVHVSFTLQVIRQARQQSEPGAPLAMVDLYDENGRLT